MLIILLVSLVRNLSNNKILLNYLTKIVINNLMIKSLSFETIE